jgi:hypothetical protein
MKSIGEAFAEYICPKKEIGKKENEKKGNWFRRDLINEKQRDELVTTFGEIDRIKDQLSDSKWLDNYKY